MLSLLFGPEEQQTSVSGDRKCIQKPIRLDCCLDANICFRSAFSWPPCTVSNIDASCYWLTPASNPRILGEGEARKKDRGILWAEVFGQF
jgi:hypothetical protein